MPKSGLSVKQSPFLISIRRTIFPSLANLQSERRQVTKQVISLRNNCSLFSRLFIASQVRNGNQAYPPALSQNRKLRSGSNSDLVGCLEDLVTSQENTSNPEVQVIILDGRAIANMLRPDYAKKFSDYASQVFLPHIVSQTQHAGRVDVVWDEYLPEILKAETGSKRGKEVRRRVEPPTAISGNWKEF